MLITLEVLHVYWTYLILKIAVQAAGEGKMQKDVRSSTDDDTNEN